MVHKNILVAFSGPCHAGKTTLINKLAKRFGDNCIVLNELIRDRKIESIDEVRRDAEKYFRLQIDVNTARANLEEKLCAENRGKIILEDRTLVDCIYYYFHYVMVPALSSSSRKEYEEYLSWLLNKTKSRFNTGFYSMIYMMKPIPAHANTDSMRPVDIVHSQANEDTMITGLTRMFDQPFCPYPGGTDDFGNMSTEVFYGTDATKCEEEMVRAILMRREQLELRTEMR